MSEPSAIATGVSGAALAAICCGLPFLPTGLGGVGLTAWLFNAGYVLIPAGIVCVGLVALSRHRRRDAADCGTSKIKKRELKS